MITVQELLRGEADGTISFGDYTLGSKTKKENFEFQGDVYKVKTFREITKLEKNDMFALESVPGSAVEGYRATGSELQFKAYGNGDVQFTLGVEPETTYEVYLDGKSIGEVATNLSGKLTVSAELQEEKAVEVKVVKVG